MSLEGRFTQSARLIGSRWARLASILLVLTGLAGCEQALRDTEPGAGQTQRLGPTLARMQKAYADLRGGRFVCLADFNTRNQAALFRIVDPEGTETKTQPAISVLRSIDRTGAGGLKARLTSPGERLLFDGRRSEKLGLVRDWRKYNLLLLNIYGPPGGLRLEFSVQSGTDVPIRWTRSLFAQPGWHLYRFDLAEIGERIDLADVRALSWRAPALTEPIDLYFDDLILTDNTRHLLNENAAEGELYVFSRGRRICVGVRGRFELAFSDGVIVEWHADDRQNLVVRSGLGPWPVPLPENWARRRADPVVYDDPALFVSWGARVTANQHLVETSGFRVVVEGVWRFLPAPAAPGAARGAPPPEHRWRYVIYSSGGVYVRTRSDGRGAGWPGPLAGYAIAVDGRVGFTRVGSPPADGRQPPANFVLLSQPGRERPDLLWCLHAPAKAERQLELVSTDQRRLAVMVGDVEAGETVDAAHLLRFWPRDIDAAPDGGSFAADYQHPARLKLSRGSVVKDAPGDLDGDGFNESEGSYELRLEAGLLRFEFVPGRTVRHQPVFRVHGTARRDCWVYADGRIIARQGRDRSGDLLFTLPEAVSRPQSVEVNTRSGSTPG